MSEAYSGGPLSDDELRVFMRLLQRYCEHDLDQFEAWRLSTAYGEVYINIRGYPLPGASAEAYEQLNILSEPDPTEQTRPPRPSSATTSRRRPKMQSRSV